MRCTAFCTARSYDLTKTSNLFKNRQYQTRLYRNVLHVTSGNTGEDIFFFSHGCIVTWGIRKRDEQKIIDLVKDFSTAPLEKIEIDHFIARLGDDTTIKTHERFNIDIITLESNTTAIKLAISYGLAQSIKLEAYEEAIQKTIKKNAHLPEELATTGKISLSGRAISKRIGEIFIERSHVNLNSEYLDVPEYFWQYSGLESYYIMTEKFLDVPRRVAALNHKLDVLSELFDMLMGQLQHRHSSLLETIIILLILLEIFISVFQIIAHH